MSYTCPVCGYPNLNEEPYSESGGGSYEICPSCGIEFGYHDAAGRDEASRRAIYSKLRHKWVSDGMKWHADDIDPPVKWDPRRQLLDLMGQ